MIFLWLFNLYVVQMSEKVKLYLKIKSIIKKAWCTCTFLNHFREETPCFYRISFVVISSDIELLWSEQISWINIFFKKNFLQGLGAFFATAKPPFGSHFFPWLFNFSIILKACFKKLFRKIVKYWWFCSCK